MPPVRPVVLVVEDEVALADMLRRALERAGYGVVTATDGATGLACVEAGDIDLVLLDLILPELDGLELCRRVRAREHGAYLPIIMLTGVMGQQHQGFLVGADDYITKPFGIEALLDRVHVWTRTRQRLVAAHDQQQRLEAERAARARLEGVLLAVRTLEHELNNTLALTVGWAGLAAADPALPAALRPAVEEARRGAEAAVDIVQRLRQLTHIEEIQWGPNLHSTIDLSRASGGVPVARRDAT